MYFFAATTQPIRIPGACNPFVAAPDTNTLELLISSINCSELIGGVWKIHMLHQIKYHCQILQILLSVLVIHLLF